MILTFLVFYFQDSLPRIWKSYSAPGAEMLDNQTLKERLAKRHAGAELTQPLGDFADSKASWSDFMDNAGDESDDFPEDADNIKDLVSQVSFYHLLG